MKSVVTLVALFITTIGFSQELEPTVLWKIDGKNIQTSYLMGTIHATCEVKLSDSMQDALEATQVLVLELDMDDPELQSKMMKHIMLPENQSISSFLNAEEQERVDAFLKENTMMSLPQVDKMSPIMIQSLLIPKMLGCPMQSYDLSLMKNASDNQEEVLGLESVEAQMSALTSLPLESQIQDLLKMAEDGIESSKEEFSLMQETYDSGNLDQLMEVMSQSEYESFSKGTEVILDQRNKNWIPRIKEIAATQYAFFAVGAAHLPGENGVINLLRAAGYTVTPVM